ncbi:MAG TPA: CopD family protein, partial [Roseiflexaceae bacterium]|nr:CopD family protein [Roseiflexaceae bacterium]
MAGVALGGGAALSFALGSHAAAMGHDVLLAVALDWLHTAAMIVWLGGLLPLLAALRVARAEGERTPYPAELAARFTRLAVTAVAVLVLTGLYATVQHVGRPELLLGTTYGRALAAKLALFAVLLALGAANLLFFTPRLRRGGRVDGLVRSVGAEALVGAGLLLLVGALTSVAPARLTWEEQQRLGQVQAARVGEVELVLWVAPAVIGENEFAVDVTDRRAGGAGVPAQVLLDFGMAGMQMGELRTELRPVGPGRYVTRGSYIAMGGRWEVAVLVRRPGFDDVRHTFVLDILRAP